jgi:preprotein translocase subunit SecE
LALGLCFELIVWKPMSSTDVETVHTGADKAKLLLSVVLFVGAFAAFFSLKSHGSLAQWAALVAGIVLAAVLFLMADAGRRLVAFGKDSVREVRKVVWPARKEATQMTAYVFVFVVIMALFLWLTDKTLQWVFFDLILGWR